MLGLKVVNEDKIGAACRSQHAAELGRMATHTLLRSHYGNQQAISCCEAL